MHQNIITPDAVQNSFASSDCTDPSSASVTFTCSPAANKSSPVTSRNAYICPIASSLNDSADTTPSPVAQNASGAVNNTVCCESGTKIILNLDQLSI